MNKIKTRSEKLIYITAVFLVCVGIIFRAYNLSWGSPYFFHPDERNIASSVSQLEYPNQMNPHFFAYGSLPIYTVYFTGVIKNQIVNLVNDSSSKPFIVPFEEAVIIGRIYSLILSILLIPLLYLLAKDICGKLCGYISVIFFSLSVGLIQFAHFSTFEIWLSFFTLLLCFLSIQLYRSKKLFDLFITAGTMGILLSIKVSSLIFIPITLVILLFSDVKLILKNKNKVLLIEKLLLKTVLFSSIVVLLFYLSNPYAWSDSSGFWNSMNYESSVALGTLPVFYTQGFISSIPILYPIQKVYPFILNPILLISFPFVFFIFIKKLIKEKSLELIVIILFLFVAFFSQSFLFVKWTRYYIPTLPFMYLIIGIAFHQILNWKLRGKRRMYSSVILVSLVLFSLIYAYSYFRTVLSSSDSRIAASYWAKDNIPINASILTETYDHGIVPFNPIFDSIKLFNFYDLDSDPSQMEKLNEALRETSYIILPSQRVLETRISNPKSFPIGSSFYMRLYGEKGFKKIYSTPCDIFCKILYLGSPIFSLEQTASVFDRPIVQIYENRQEKLNRVQK